MASRSSHHPLGPQSWQPGQGCDLSGAIFLTCVTGMFYFIISTLSTRYGCPRAKL